MRVFFRERETTFVILVFFIVMGTEVGIAKFQEQFTETVLTLSELAFSDALGAPTGAFSSKLEASTAEMRRLGQAVSAAFVPWNDKRMGLADFETLCAFVACNSPNTQVSPSTISVNLDENGNVYFFYNELVPISSAELLTELKELSSLCIEKPQIPIPDGYAFLTRMPQLRELYLCRGGPSDISVLNAARQVEGLSLEGNNIEDLGPLRNFSELQRLNLEFNVISSVEPLAGLAKLTHLSLRGNVIDDISPILELSSLTRLTLQGNHLTALPRLSTLRNLTKLDISDNPIEALSGICDLPHLEMLTVSRSRLSPASRDMLQTLESTGTTVILK